MMAEKYIYGRNCMSDHNHVPHAKNRAGVPQGSASAEAAVLQKLMPEYVSLYRIEANSGEYEILRLEGNTNAAELVKESCIPMRILMSIPASMRGAFFCRRSRRSLRIGFFAGT